MLVAMATTPARRDLALLFRRAGFGAGAAELDAAEKVGYEATVERLLTGLRTPPGGDKLALPKLTGAQEGAGRAQDEAALIFWWMSRMVTTATPLRERLVLFWHGHFATSIQKVRLATLMLAQNQLFRQVGAGGFERLVQAVAKDPAMMIWLDSGKNDKTDPNENFARELLELFTLGIGHYSEADVKEAARAFTGWRFDRASGLDRSPGFVLKADRHDDGVKTVLGHTGQLGGEDVIHLVVQEADSARFVASRIWSHFARPAAPDDPVVADLAAAYTAGGRTITPLLRAVFLHPEFRSDATRNGLVKTPIAYVVGVLRALGVDVDGHIGQVLSDLAQLPFSPPSVAGWPQNGYWLTAASALTRLAFAEEIVKRANLESIGSVPPAGRLDAVARMLSIDEWSQPTAAALGPLADDHRTLVALALTTPEYVLA
ncbi:MAG: hypothetical protein QOG64_3214 [Acidimicrobiaceae bacterium]|nr:hypothetical protein [Acidimicrobiaceae bacterium]